MFGCTSELENYQLEKSTEESILQLEIDILDGEYSFSTEERQRVIDMVFDGSTKTYIEELKKVKEKLVLNPELKEIYKKRLNGLEQKKYNSVSLRTTDDDDDDILFHKVTFINQQDVSFVDYVWLFSSRTLLDVSRDANLEPLVWCEEAGASSACVMKIQMGGVEQSAQSYLYPEDVDRGFVLPCVAYSTSKLWLFTEMQGELGY